MPYCPNCGADAGAGSRFCNNCGANLSPSPDAPPYDDRYRDQYADRYEEQYGGQYPGQYGYGTAPSVPDYLVQSILVTLFCCMPFGVAAIVFAAQANSKKGSGDFAGALEAAGKAKSFCLISVGVSAALLLIYAVFALVAASGA